MRCQLAVLSILVCLISVTWAAAPSRAEGPEAPVWTNGDFWEYEGSLQAEGIWVDLNMRMEVAGIEQISVKGSIYECYLLDVDVEMDMQGMTVAMTMKMWARVSDIASVRTRTTVLGETTTISYDPPVPYEWPLEVGAEWSGTTTMITESSQLGNSEETVDYTAEVERKRSITVPAGTFETYEIKVAMTGIGDSRNFYAPGVGNDIRTQSSQLLGTDAPIDLVDFKFGSTTPGGPEGALDLIWPILIIVVIVVVVAVAILAWRMRRKPAAWPIEMPPQQPAQQPPQVPPPPPGW